MREPPEIAFIARADNSGLGSLSLEFVNHLKPKKILVIKNGVYRAFPERYSGYDYQVSTRDISQESMEWLLAGVRVLVCVETPYNWRLYNLARYRGIKVVMIPMYEGMKPNAPPPDLYLCTSKLDYNEFPEPKVFFPWPVNRDKIPYRRRTKADIFLHNAGHGGMFGRNGTQELLRAMRYVRSDIKLVINSQIQLSCDDPRVEVRVGNRMNYEDVWGEGDVFVFPEKFNALCLPINEALAAGMPIIATNRFPFNDFLPKQLLVDVEDEIMVKICRRIKMSIPSAEDIARKIDAIAHQDITALSDESNRLANNISWERLQNAYIETLWSVL